MGGLRMRAALALLAGSVAWTGCGSSSAPDGDAPKDGDPGVGGGGAPGPVEDQEPTPGATSPEDGPQQPATYVRALFVLERQRSDLSDLAGMVSEPTSALYGHYLTVTEVAEEYGATQETLDALNEFLVAHEVSPAHFDVTRSFGVVRLEKEQVESIFGGFADSPPVPSDLVGIATGVLGGFRVLQLANSEVSPPSDDSFVELDYQLTSSEPWPAWAQTSGSPHTCPSGNAADCVPGFAHPGTPEEYQAFHPAQLRKAYGIGDRVLKPGRSAVVIEFGALANADYLATYAKGVGVPVPRLTQWTYDGASDGKQSGSSQEAVLDVETIAGMAPGVELITVLNANGRTLGEEAAAFAFLFSEALNVRMTGGLLTDVISVSLAACEPKWVGPSAVGTRAIETVLQTAAVVGVAVAVGSGDQGSSSCTTRTLPFKNTERAVEYPATSPWVTSVGGTHLLLDANDNIVSIGAWNDWPLTLDHALPGLCDTPPCRPAPNWAGGGGPSVVHEAPWWQKRVNESLVRIVPDVSFMADIYPGVIKYDTGAWQGSASGTSQAAPIFAATVLFYNDAAEEHAKPRMGFPNPALYNMGELTPGAFHDATTGNNQIGDNDAPFGVDCCDAGVGYDMATGWGSIKVDVVLGAFSK